jgi:hypothetical protein
MLDVAQPVSTINRTAALVITFIWISLFTEPTWKMYTNKCGKPVRGWF